MKAILIGYGEIGQAVKEVFSNFHDIDVVKKEGDEIPGQSYDLMLVAIPYTDKFVEIMEDYKSKVNVNSIVVFSSVQIGTCSQIGAIHSPIEGLHPHLVESLKNCRRWVGGSDELVNKFFAESKLSCRQFEKPEITEALKLSSTALYGLNILFANYRKKIADDLDFDFSNFKAYDKDYNNLYQSLCMPQYQRYLLDPPEGEIGGHCIVPNAKILMKKYPSVFLDRIIKQK